MHAAPPVEAGGARPVAASPTLRYGFEPGQHWVYEQRTRTAAGDRGFAQVQIWVLEQRGDRWRLLIDRIDVVDGAAEPMDGIVVEVDRVGAVSVPEPWLDRVGDFADELALLPGLAGVHADGRLWRSAADLLGRRAACRVRDAEPNHPQVTRVEFTMDDDCGVDALRGQTRQGMFWFDRQRGGVAALELEVRDADGKVQRAWRSRLRQWQRHDATWQQRRQAECARYTQAVRLQRALRAELDRGAVDIDAALRQLRTIWQEAANDLQVREDSPFRTLARGRSAALPSLANRWRREASIVAQSVGQPAATWSLQDPNGVTVGSEQFAGTPRLELFWRSGDADSVRMLATVRAWQAEDEARQAVCLNLDGDPAAAARAIERCGGGLRHVLAAPLAADVLPGRLPLLRMIDGEGVVRRLSWGWRPTLDGLAWPK